MAGTTGKLNMDAHEFAEAVITGAAGKTTTLTIFPAPQDPVPVVPADMEPHVIAKT